MRWQPVVLASAGDIASKMAGSLRPGLERPGLECSWCDKGARRCGATTGTVRDHVHRPVPPIRHALGLDFHCHAGATIADPFGSNDDRLPGAIPLCLRKGASAPCDTQLQATLPDTSTHSPLSERHYLNKAEIVRPHGKSGRPVLLVVTASLRSGDGDQLVLTQALAYQAGPDHFVRVYEHPTDTNSNQEVRSMNEEPLAGDIILVNDGPRRPRCAQNWQQ